MTPLINGRLYVPGYRGAIASVLLWAAAAHAGVVVELSPMPSSSPGLPKGAYLGGELVSVDVLLTQNPPSDDVFIRFLRFDFDDTDSDLQLSLPVSLLKMSSEPESTHVWNKPHPMCGWFRCLFGVFYPVRPA